MHFYHCGTQKESDLNLLKQLLSFLAPPKEHNFRHWQSLPSLAAFKLTLLWQYPLWPLSKHFWQPFIKLHFFLLSFPQPQKILVDREEKKRGFSYDFFVWKKRVVLSSPVTQISVQRRIKIEGGETFWFENWHLLFWNENHFIVFSEFVPEIKVWNAKNTIFGDFKMLNSM